jgi:hypothetical protein
MSILKVCAIVVGLQLIAAPVLAQGTTTKNPLHNAHTYQGEPKTEVPHSMKKAKKSTTTTGQAGASGGHHYQGGPKTEVPHHMQDKK